MWSRVEVARKQIRRQEEALKKGLRWHREGIQKKRVGAEQTRKERGKEEGAV